MRFSRESPPSAGVLAVVGLAATAGCSASRRIVAADLEPSSILVIAKLEDRRLSKVLIRTLESGHANVEAEDREELVMFPFAPGDLLDERGDALTEDEFAAELEGAGPACRFCLFPSVRAPTILHEGGACPIPRDVPAIGVELSESETAALRRSIRLSRAGPCPRVPSASVEPVPLLVPTPLPEHPYELVVHSEGVTFLFSERFAAIVDRGGIARRTEAVPFTGPLLAGVGLSEGRILVASLDVGMPGATRWDLVRADLSFVHIESEGGADGILFRPKALTPLDGSRFHGAGYRSPLFDRTSGALAVTCELTSTLACEVDLDDQGLTLTDRKFSASVYDPSGLVAAGTSLADLVVRTPEGTRTTRVMIDAQVSKLGEFAPLFWKGGDLYACVRLSSTAALYAWDVGSAQPPRLVERWPYSSCGGSWQTPSGPRLSLDDGRVFSIDDAGQVRAEGSHPMEAGILEPVRIYPAPVGEVLVRGGMNELFGGPSTGPWEKLYAPPWAAGDVASGVVPADEGEALVVWDSPPSLELVSFRQAPPTRSPGPELPLAEDESLLAVERDPRARALVVSGEAGTRPFLRRMDLDTGTVEELSHALGSSRLTALVAVTRDVFVAVGEGWLAVRIEGSEVTPIELDWDDPGTLAAELKPTRGERGCATRLSLGDASAAVRAFHAVDAAGGIAWASGCDAVVFRIMPFGPRPYGLRVMLRDELRSVDDSLLDQRTASLQAVRAIAPAWAVLASPQYADTLGDRAHVVEAVRGIGADPGRTDDLLTRLYVHNSAPAVGRTNHSTGNVLDVVGEEPNLVLVHADDEGGSKVMRSQDRPFRWPLEATAAWMQGEDLVVAFAHGYLTVGRLESP
ncbi:MAG: hypothetical protein HYV07_20740 [Deltaproteobacteria bacterium]|nr:hypothetical protein [Deltaproteobacteria bacterium]